MNQKVVDYITQSRLSGVSDTAIKQRLLENGWAEPFIDEALLAERPVMVTVNNSDTPSVNNSTKSVTEESMVSPYSRILAIVLGVSLFILADGIFSDIKQSVQDTNIMMLYQGLFIIPFLLVGFLLHNFFSDKKRFSILSFPYFAVSVWLLVRLLFKVGKYILDKNAALGVYVILGGVLIVLTTIIIVVQKNKKS